MHYYHETRRHTLKRLFLLLPLALLLLTGCDKASTATSTAQSASTATKVPTATQSAKPTPTTVQQQSIQAPPAAPATGVNGNPWGYDFNPGSYITDPPADFCTHFNCIESFWSGKGHVEECEDTMYSKSGGLAGSCSKHEGDLRPLYQHP